MYARFARNEHEERALEMRFLYGKYNPKYVLRDNHPLEAGDGCCVKLLPDGADATAASVRTTVSDSVRVEIEAKLATRVGPGVVPVCRICKGLTRKSACWRNSRMAVLRLHERAEDIVWHLQSCHGKEFEKRDILFANVEVG